MGFISGIQSKLLQSFPVKFMRGIELPILHLSVWDFLVIYVRGIIKGALTLRAAAISWSLFLALFPFLLFLFALLPELPHYADLQQSIYQKVLPNIFPVEVAKYISQTLDELLNNRDYSLFNFTTILALFFATNGFVGLLNGFYRTGRSVLNKERIFHSYFFAFILTMVTSLLVIVVLLSLYYAQFVSLFPLGKGWNSLSSYLDLSFIGVFYFVLHFFYMLFLYYFGASPKLGRSWRRVFPGALLTSILFFVSIVLFRSYLEWFNNYQLLYGTIGIFLVVMLWVYVNVIIVLIGFELNVAIAYTADGRHLKVQEMDSAWGEDDD